MFNNTKIPCFVAQLEPFFNTALVLAGTTRVIKNLNNITRLTTKQGEFENMFLLSNYPLFFYRKKTITNYFSVNIFFLLITLILLNKSMLKIV